MKVVTFGEIMMRFQPQDHQRFMQADKYDMCFGGGEANVAVSLAQLNIDSVFCTKLPNNPLANACIKELKGYGVDTSYIARGGRRVGIYFVEKGASQRPSNVIYDRADSAITEIETEDVDIDKLLDGADWFHFTGITPALGEKPRAFLNKLLSKAKKLGITVSCDLNYRNKLWSRDEACKVMTELMDYVDVLISNEEDVKDVFGIEALASDITGGQLSAEGYANVAKEIINKFSLKKVAFTLRESISASENNWSGILCDAEGFVQAKKYHLNIVDRIGGGDAFAAGLIYAMLNCQGDKDAIETAVAAGALKHSVIGDFNIISESELKRLKGGDGSGRVQR